MRNIPYRAHPSDIPVSFYLFTTTLALPHIPHSRLSRQFRSCYRHRGDFRLHCPFHPHCSNYRCFECSLSESPILHWKNPRCPSSSNELTIIDLFFFIQILPSSSEQEKSDALLSDMYLSLSPAFPPTGWLACRFLS